MAAHPVPRAAPSDSHCLYSALASVIMCVLRNGMSVLVWWLLRMYTTACRLLMASLREASGAFGKFIQCFQQGLCGCSRCVLDGDGGFFLGSLRRFLQGCNAPRTPFVLTSGAA